MSSRFPKRPKSPHVEWNRSDFRKQSIEFLDRAGVEQAVLASIRGGRKILEANPDRFGILLANGVRDPGTLDHAAREAQDEYESNRLDYHAPPKRKSARVSARIFAAIAYKQPFFDGNKRTGLLGGTIVAAMLGFDIRDSDYADVEEEVRQLSARNATVEEVAGWFLEKVLISPRREER
jgi:prophage maintenance system killer protein